MSTVVLALAEHSALLRALDLGHEDLGETWQ